MRLGETAFLLAAGLGQRMRPLTLTTPKPLIPVAGVPIIDHVMARLRAGHVQRVVANAHYLGEQIFAWGAAQSNPPVTISDEREGLLDTGGGILKALPMLGAAPFFVVNGDSFWTEPKPGICPPALQRLKDAWRDADMDCLLLLAKPENTRGHDGSKGDFIIDCDGRLSRAKGALAPIYIGAYLVHPRLFAEAPHTEKFSAPKFSTPKFSMNTLWDIAISKGRLFGIVHQGVWLHVGTPEAIAIAEAELRKQG